ncbi:MAG: type I methionyl aminopeptidase [Saprospiraceae bacterium]|nr:type I methionyl aminopeptidase [Bacteroidia bacterium]MBT8230697.1 type I methionyl aminopeptidase [Bacteroidia bacterium]NNF20932.1 type I methionyl aminopeptidase [Saprospiraceae bacterium]NNK89025.1 type I methionyl aminopeptidase [Saprospiraceae bacterium]
MIYYKTREDIEQIRESCLLVTKTLAHVASLLKPGVTGTQLDKEAETFIRDHNAKPGFKGYGGFPATLCISPNEAVVHGIPVDTPFTEKDIISIDCGSFMNGYFGDSAFTFAMGDVKEDVMELLVTTYESLYKGIEQAKCGNRIGDIGYAIQHHNEQKSYSVVRELVGHGIGKSLHEAPEIPNYGKRGRGPKIKEGLVIAIEPMINMGVKSVKQMGDGWTIVTKDGKPSAHYEHTIAVLEDKTEILSDHSVILEAVKNNPEIRNISLKS